MGERPSERSFWLQSSGLFAGQRAPAAAVPLLSDGGYSEGLGDYSADFVGILAVAVMAGFSAFFWRSADGLAGETDRGIGTVSLRVVRNTVMPARGVQSWQTLN